MIELPPGTTFGPYVLGQRLGVGGMGAVYAATDGNAPVAIKFLSLGAEPEDLARFEREAEAHARVDTHPNVARVHSAGVYAGQAYLVMDLLPGGDLESRLRLGPLDPEEARELGVSLARGLAHVHAQNVLHRDIKPANVLFDEQGRPRLTDFGLARPVEATSLTQSGVLLGTPGYMAPEQAGLGETTVAADVFGLGATLYGALTGNAPFVGATLLATLNLLLHEPPPPLPPEVPADLRAAIFRSLEKDPADRFPSAAAFAEALESEGTSVPRRALTTVLAALTLGVLALIAALVLRSTRAPSPQPTRVPSRRPSAAASLSPSASPPARPAAEDWNLKGTELGYALLAPGNTPEAVREATSVLTTWLGPRRFVTLADNGLVRTWAPGSGGRPRGTTIARFDALDLRGSFVRAEFVGEHLAWGSGYAPLQFLTLTDADPMAPPQIVRTPHSKLGTQGEPKGLRPRHLRPLSDGRLLAFGDARVGLWRAGSTHFEWVVSLGLSREATSTPNGSLLLSEAAGTFELVLAWVPGGAAEDTSVQPQVERIQVGPTGSKRLALKPSKGRLRAFVRAEGQVYCGDDVGNILVSTDPSGPYKKSPLLRPDAEFLVGAHEGAIRGLGLGRDGTLVSLGADVPDLRIWRLPSTRLQTLNLTRQGGPVSLLRISPDRRFALVQFRTRVALVSLAFDEALPGD